MPLIQREMIDQFLSDLDDWLCQRGENLFVSRKMVERSRLTKYWAEWLARMRATDGLPDHAEPQCA